MKEIEDMNMANVFELLVDRCKGFSSLRTIKQILSLGLLSKRKCRAFLAKKMVKELTDAGVKRKSAIKTVAEKMRCSEATIRTYMYYKVKD